MAIIRTEKENGENHLPAGWLSGFATLCGLSDDSDTAISDAHEGTVVNNGLKVIHFSSSPTV